MENCNHVFEGHADGVTCKRCGLRMTTDEYVAYLTPPQQEPEHDADEKPEAKPQQEPDVPRNEEPETPKKPKRTRKPKEEPEHE